MIRALFPASDFSSTADGSLPDSQANSVHIRAQQEISDSPSGLSV
jgi:hypothetical protein